MTTTIKVGDKIPAATLREKTADGPKPVSTDDVFAGKTVVLFSVPGAFTPTCSAKHLPGFLAHEKEFKAKGVDTIACVSVNDPFVMDAWAKDQKVDGRVRMLADGNGELAEKLGLVLDGTGFGLGKRSQRFALIAKNGVVTHLAVEKPGAFEVSSAEAVLKAL